MIFKTKRKLLALLSVYACFLVIMMACGNSALTGLSTTGTTGTTGGTGGTGGGTGTALTLTGGTPSGVLTVGTTQATLSLTTNVNATCKYSTFSGVSYASMTNTFATTGSTAQSTTVTGLKNGTSYNYYVKCQDTSGNVSGDFPISFAVASATGGNSYYVDIVNGSDSNNGSITSPWKYIDTSAHKLAPGDTLYVRKGTYTLSPAASSSGSLYLVSANGDDGAAGYLKTVKNYPGETPVVSFGIRQCASYWRWEGLNFTGDFYARPYNAWSSLALNQYPNNTAPMAHETGEWPHDIQLVGNKFTGTYSYAALETYASNLLIENNDMTGVHSTSTNSLYQNIYVSSGDNIVIRGNLVAGQSAYGIQLYDEKRDSSETFTRWISNVVIEDNVLFNLPGGTAQGITTGGGTQSFVQNLIIRNNVVLGVTYAGIQIGGGEDSVKVYNNTVFQPMSGAPCFRDRALGGRPATTNLVVENNIFDLGASYSTGYHIDTSNLSFTLNNNLYENTPRVTGGTTTDAKPIVGDPKFVNPSIDSTVADFHLQSGSAAIDTGLTLTDVPVDFEGTARPQGPAYDIGAYEYH